MSEPKLDRRLFLGAAMAMAALRPSRAAMTANPDVAIIGAGLAGLSAAHTLMAGGRTVILLEALPRLGGRAYTDRTSLGVMFDRGAAYLESATLNPLRQMGRRLGFQLSPHEPDESVFVQGRPASADETQAFATATDNLVKALIEAAEHDEGPDVSLADAAKDVMASDAWAPTAAAITVVTDDGADMTDVSLRDWAGRKGGDPYVDVHEGIGTLVQRIADGVPVSLNTRVLAVRERPQGVTVETSQGTLTANAAIVTVSPAVLASGAIKFEPALPGSIADAAAALPMGHLEKVALAFGAKAPSVRGGEALLIPKITDARNYYFHRAPHGQPLLIHYAGGSWAQSLTAQGATAAIDAAKSALTAMLGSNALQGLTGAAATRWGADPAFLGAYAVARPGGLAARINLGKPFSNRIWLSGEALAETRAQSLDGAWRSGQKTAEFVLNRLRRV